MKLLFLFVIVLFVGSSCQHQKPDYAIASDSLQRTSYSNLEIRTDTTLFGQPEAVGDLDDDMLSESSGVAASKANPGYLWTVEDSGNGNKIQLITPKGDVIGQYTLAGLTNIDWEDMTVGPGPIPGKSYVYVAEIGDNREQRPLKTIYRFLEPTLQGTKRPVNATITHIDAIRLKLPDGSRNAEAILLDPGTLDLYILSKGHESILYRAAYPQAMIKPTVMKRMLLLPFGNLTSAAMSPGGNEILIRSYRQLVYYKRQAGESVTDALKRIPVQLPLAEESQGEAVGWAANGSGYYTTSETPIFTTQHIYFYRRNWLRKG